MKSNNILHIRSYINYGPTSINDEVYHKDKSGLKYIPNNAEYFISLQPGLWNINTLIEIYSFTSTKPNMLEVLSNSSEVFRRKCCFKFLCENIKLSEDSLLFPHIHTITCGKWVLNNDFYKVLPSLFKEYKINVKNRGIY